MLPRYIFHKDSEEDLKQFFSIAAELSTNNNAQLIRTYLDEVATQKQQHQPVEDLTIHHSEMKESNDDVVIVEAKNKESIQNTIGAEKVVEVDCFNSSISTELIETITENLLLQTHISQSDFKKLNMFCNKEQIKSVILQIKDKFDIKAICNCGMKFVDCEIEDVNVVFVLFYEHILFPLLHIEQSAVFQEMFNKVYKKFHKIINKDDIVKTLLQAYCSGIFLENISKIDSELKSEIIRKLTINSRQLEQIHVKVLDSLLDKNTHHSTIKVIIALLISQGETKDISTGKLIVSLMQILGRNIYQFEQPLREIITKHKSVLKTKLQTTFDLYYQCSQLSQTLIKH